MYGLILFCVLLAHASALSCYNCTYVLTSSSNTVINRAISGLTAGNSDCWDTPSTGTTQCASGVTSCYTTRADMTATASSSSFSAEYSLKYVRKYCGSTETTDTCGVKAASDILTESGIEAALSNIGVTSSASGDVTACICTKDNCNHSNTLQYSVLMMIFSTVAALMSL